MSQSLNRVELAALVGKQASSGESGTIIIRGDDGHVLMVALDKGRLASLSYGNHRGLEAIPDILAFSSGTFSFSEGLVTHPQEGLPTTTEFLDMLRSGVSNLTSPGKTSSKKGSGGSFRNLPLFMKQLSELLMEFVGPIAPLLCENALADANGVDSVEDAALLAKQLAQEIADKNDQGRFLSRVSSLLKQY